MSKLTVNSYVKITTPDGDYRFGFVEKTAEGGWHVVICMHEEGESKLGYEAEEFETVGEPPIDWEAVLTPTEKRMIPMLADGLANKEIGERLSLSPATVRVHTRNLRMKLQLDSRAQLVIYAQGLANRIGSQVLTA